VIREKKSIQLLVETKRLRPVRLMVFEETRDCLTENSVSSFKYLDFKEILKRVVLEFSQVSN